MILDDSGRALAGDAPCFSAPSAIQTALALRQAIGGTARIVRLLPAEASFTVKSSGNRLLSVAAGHTLSATFVFQRLEGLSRMQAVSLFQEDAHGDGPSKSDSFRYRGARAPGLLAVGKVSRPADAEAREVRVPSRRELRRPPQGVRYLLQGLVVCKRCGYAFCGQPMTHARKGDGKRTYQYCFCTGSMFSRCDRERICRNKPVRMERLDSAVWEDVRNLLAEPSRGASRPSTGVAWRAGGPRTGREAHQSIR